MATIDKIKKFDLGWRFYDIKYNILPKEILAKITIQSKQDSKKIWNTYIDSRCLKINLLKSNKWKSLNKINEFPLHWGEDVENDKKKLYSLPIDKNENIVIFWSPFLSIETRWDIFINWWDDFFYPSDDNNVIIIENSQKLLVYIEDYISVYELPKPSIRQMEKEIDLLKGILAENFKYYKYNEAIKRVILTLEKGNISNEIWFKIKTLINNRLLPKGVAFDLVAYDANLPLDEDTEIEAYRWLDLLIKNIENKNNIVEYGQELESNKFPYKTINGRDFTKEEWEAYEKEEYRKYIEKKNNFTIPI